MIGKDIGDNIKVSLRMEQDQDRIH